MKILGIETSCDETAISLIEAKGALKSPDFKVLSNITLSQAKLHAKYGGVFPNLAKREHSKNLIPVLKQVLEESNFLKLKVESLPAGEAGSKHASPAGRLKAKSRKLEAILSREPELLKQFLEFIPTVEKPKIDKIAVTYGPGLEPALWVGINFAKALSLVWDIPVIPINHMEGHIASILPVQNRGSSKSKTLYPKPYTLNPNITFPALALLISGGHTELVSIKKWGDYKVLGETRDDAVGETYDKVARMLELPYPGGPEISRLAEEARKSKAVNYSTIKLPRPMINSENSDFSFSGLKTAVLYFLKNKTITPNLQKEVSKEFEDAVKEVLVYKTKKALEETKAKSLIIAGGVSANKFLRESFKKEFEKGVTILIPPFELSTDNALMIAVSAFIKIKTRSKIPQTFSAQGNLSFTRQLNTKN